MLLLSELAHEAGEKIYRAIAATRSERRLLRPILRPYDSAGSTRHVDFDTVLPTWTTDPNKCHVSHVVADTGTWEQKVAQSLEEMDEVQCYVKNQNLGFYIPYTINGEEHNYEPDFIARILHASETLHLIIEVSGRKKKEKDAKTATARNLWGPAVNNHGGFGHWAFIEVIDPWDVKNTIEHFLRNDAVEDTLK